MIILRNKSQIPYEMLYMGCNISAVDKFCSTEFISVFESMQGSV